MSSIAYATQFRTVRLENLPELATLFERIKSVYSPKGVFLYGSRARAEARDDSDWDVKVVVSDDAPDELFSPMLGWKVQEGSGVYADVSCVRISDFQADLDIPNTAAKEVQRDGILIEAI